MIPDRLAHAGSATLFEVNGKRGAMQCDIKPIPIGARFAGRARTVQIVPGDNLALHAAVPSLRAGEVLVVDAGGFLAMAVWGDVLTSAAIGMAAAAVVIDGAVRDVEAIQDLGFPIFAKGVAIPGPFKKHPGTLDQPIICGGVSVNPGDWVVGDADGVVVLAADPIEEILSAAEKRAAFESATSRALRKGETTTIDALGLAEAIARVGMVGE